jgi:hypothetical protein
MLSTISTIRKRMVRERKWIMARAPGQIRQNGPVTAPLVDPMRPIEETKTIDAKRADNPMSEAIENLERERETREESRRLSHHHPVFAGLLALMLRAIIAKHTFEIFTKLTVHRV